MLPPLDSCADARALKTVAAPARPGAARAGAVAARTAGDAVGDGGGGTATGRRSNRWARWSTRSRAAGHEPLLAEALIVYARVRSPFDPEGAEPIYEEAFKRGEAIRNDELAAEAAIQLVAIAGAIGHQFDRGERWARIAEMTVERGVPLRVRGSFLHNRGTLFAARGSWRLAEGDFSAAVAIRQQALGAAHPDLAASMINLARAVLVLGDAAPRARASRTARSPSRRRSFPPNPTRSAPRVWFAGRPCSRSTAAPKRAPTWKPCSTPSSACSAVITRSSPIR